MADFAIAMRKIVLEAVASSNPADLAFGTVETLNPISIKLDQKLILPEPNLILTRNVLDYEVEMEIGGTKQTVKVLNALEIGDKVMLIKNQGGQQYIVLEKVVE